MEHTPIAPFDEVATGHGAGTGAGNQVQAAIRARIVACDKGGMN